MRQRADADEQQKADLGEFQRRVNGVRVGRRRLGAGEDDIRARGQLGQFGDRGRISRWATGRVIDPAVKRAGVAISETPTVMPIQVKLIQAGLSKALRIRCDTRI